MYEVADKANKAVGRGLASAVEKGEEATEATKETLGMAFNAPDTPKKLTRADAGTTAAKTKQSADVAGQKANQVSGLTRH